MRKFASGALAMALCLMLSVRAQAASLIPVGEVIGLELTNGAVTVVAFDEVIGGCARAAGLQVGDQILDIDGITIKNAKDIRNALDRSDGKVELVVRRQEKEHTLFLSPQITDQGPRLGVSLRQGITGLGTVTWYDPATGKFGCLGHGVSDSSGELVKMTAGTAYDASVLSVKPGKCGEPGQLRGGVDGKVPLGSLEKNTGQGVFGTADTGWTGQTMDTASDDAVRTGPAIIRSTVEGNEVREYSVEILKLYPTPKAQGRNMLIRVTDPELLNTTGGIVQGMSGSPIIQDGCLVGAVTHVLVNDPTTGYGIFIDNMLEAAA